MAKRRRNRRNKRKNNRSHNTQQKSLVDEVPNNTQQKILLEEAPNNITTTPITHRVTETPFRSNSLVLRKKMNNETQRSRSNSFVTPKNRYYNTLNCTNLNKLFESNKVDKRNNERINASTQTCFEKSTEYPVDSKLYKLFNESNNIPSIAQIIETPKIPFEFSPNYSAFAEENPAVSTPLNLYNKTLISSAKGTPLNNDLFVNMAKNMIANKKINEEKKFVPVVFDKERLSTINKQRFYKSISPKVNRNAYIKLSGRLNNTFATDLPKSYSPAKRFVLGRSENYAHANSGSVCNRMLARLKSFHRKYSSKWSGKFMEMCAWFGLTVKMGLVAIYSPNKPKHSCPCEFYKVKVEELEAKLETIQVAHKEEIARLTEDVRKIQEELEGLSDLKKEIHEIKGKLRCVSGICGDGNNTRPPPPPPIAYAPPPPPPPPPVPPPLPLSTPTGRKIKINRESKQKENESVRPIISLDDILKVKLRKTGERQIPRLQRRSTQPVISLDMLKQVKLRPASRPQTPTFSQLSSSPASTLTRILSKVDTNVCRVKRLRHVGAYSSDDLSRKMHEFKREHCGLVGRV